MLWSGQYERILNPKSQAPPSSASPVHHPVDKNLFVKFTRESYHEIEITLRPEVAVRDVVILKDDLTNQMFWKLAKVEELLPWSDGLVSFNC